jgi:membrane protease subunit (stomatin/prohibitin family)
LRDPTMAAATLVGAQASALEAAAANESGAMTGFMGLGLAQSAIGGVNPSSLYAMGQQPPPQGPFDTGPAHDAAAAPGWTCTCGAHNSGKFCAECGIAKPAGVPQYRCDKCGWVPPDPTKPSKFCPECGDPFDDGDLV